MSGGGRLSHGTASALRAQLRIGCSGALFEVLDRAHGHRATTEERAAVLLSGGILQHGHQCGMIWGAALAAGAQAFRVLGAGPRAEARAIVAAGRVLEAFRGQNTHVDCVDITDIDRSSSGWKMFSYFFLKGGSVGCARRSARFAPAALAAIDATLTEEEPPAPPLPVSCAAALARRMGLSDEHATTAAGLAGGIGLGGGACGALGAAIWIAAMKALGAGAPGVGLRFPAAVELVERFLACTGYEFECAAIVGRRFAGVADHARYVCGGGCAKLLEALAETGPPPAAGVTRPG